MCGIGGIGRKRKRIEKEQKQTLTERETERDPERSNETIRSLTKSRPNPRA